MNIFVTLYTEALFRPLFNLLVGITNTIPGHNVGLAIIVVTIIVRLILLPPALQQARNMHKNQEKMRELSKDLEAIKKKHKDDKTKQAQETMELYRRAGINPASGCLPLLVQLPILIALYRVFLIGLGEDTFQYLYSFVSAPMNVSLVFLSIPLDSPSLLLGVIAGVGQFIMMRWFTAAPTHQPGANDDAAAMMQSMQKNMMYFFPVMTVVIALQLPAALSLYWVASTLFAIVQQYVMKRYLNVGAALPAV